MMSQAPALLNWLSPPIVNNSNDTPDLASSRQAPDIMPERLAYESEMRRGTLDDGVGMIDDVMDEASE
jgi:hypothetical protein